MPILELDAKEAMRLAHSAAKWPSRAVGGERLEPRCEPVIFPKFTFDGNVSIFTVGSCFARNIEEYLARLGLDVPATTFSAPKSEMLVPSDRETVLLNKYTPDSMLVEVRMALDSNYKLSVDDCLIETSPGMFLDMQLATHIPVTLERAQARRREVVNTFKAITKCQLVVITLGLIESWFDTRTGVAICYTPTPRLVAAHPGRFRLRVLTFAEVITAMAELLDVIRAAGPGKRFLVTTSPVPLGRTFTGQDVIVANTHSKSLLRAAAAELAYDSPDVDYFPSYECVTLSNRDSAWADDLRHVRDDLVGYVVGRVSAHYFPFLHKEQIAAFDHAAAKQLVSLGQFEAAYIAFDTYRDAKQQNAVFLVDFAELCRRMGKHEEAATLMSRALDNGSQSSQRHAFAAEMSIRSGSNWERAEKHARSALRLDPGNPTYKIMLLRALVGSGQKEKAAGQIEVCLAAVRDKNTRALRLFDIRSLRNACKALEKAEAAQEAQQFLRRLFPNHVKDITTSPKSKKSMRQ